MTEGKQIIDLSQVPHWPTTPVELVALSAPGSTKQVILEHHPDRRVAYGPQVEALVDRYLRPKENPNNFYNGEYANVEAIEIDPSTIKVITGVTNAFPYIAAAWHYRNDPGANPIHPLAVQTVVFDTETHNTILVERRPADIVDHPLKLSVLGGALKPGEGPRAGACRCLAKWGIKLDPNLMQLKTLALTHEPADRIYCIVFATELPGDQIAEIVHNLAGKRDLWAEPIANYDDAYSNLLEGERSIHDWNPLGYAAFACGAFVRWEQERSEAALREFFSKVRCRLTHKGWYNYQFPMEAHVPPDVTI